MSDPTSDADKDEPISEEARRQSNASIFSSAADTIEEPIDIEQSLFEEIEDTTGGALKPFLDEYKKLQQALVKSHESEQRFVMKCRELSINIQECRENMSNFEAAKEENKHKEEVLERQIEMTAVAKAKLEGEMGERVKETSELRTELSNLNRKLDSWSQVLYEEQEQVVGGLERELDEISLRRDRERSVLATLRKDNAALSSRVELMEHDKEKEEQEIADLNDRIAEIEASVQEKSEEKDMLEKTTDGLKNLCTQRSLEIGRKAERTRKSRQELMQERAQLKDAMKTATSSTTKLSRLNEDAQELEDRFQEQQDNTEEVVAIISAQQLAIDQDDEILAICEKDLQKKNSILRKLKARMRRAEEDLAAVEEKKAGFVQALTEKRLEVKSAMSAAAVTARALDVSSREREVLSHDHGSKLESVASHKVALNVAENASRNMENELRAFNTAVKGWKSLIEQLVQDTDAYKDELDRKEERTKKALEKSAAKDLQILALQKAIVEQEGRRRQQQNLLEAVRSDRNMYSKTLLEQKHEMNEFRRVFESLNHAIIHVQQELNDKESAFVNEHLRVEQVDEEISSIEQRTRLIQGRYDQTNERVKAQEAQISKLTGIINEADEELQAQTKQYNAVVNEERVLSAQLVSRNEELAQLYEILRLQNSKMKKGEEHYRKRRKEYVEIVDAREDLTKELEAINFDREEIDKYKKAIVDMDKMLLQERLRVRALEDELKKPMNVHRWRQMQDTNAETFTMIRQVQDLQKSIINKSSHLRDRDGKIQQKEKLYVDLRRILARQPGQEAREQLRIYEAALKDKKSKHRAMQAELKMHQAKVYELKYEIEKLYKSLDLTKVAYFQRRRSEARAVAATQHEHSVAALKQMYLDQGDNPIDRSEDHVSIGEFSPKDGSTPHQDDGDAYIADRDPSWNRKTTLNDAEGFKEEIDAL